MRVVRRRLALITVIAAALGGAGATRLARSATVPAPVAQEVAGLALLLEPVALARKTQQEWRLTNTGTVPILPPRSGEGFLGFLEDLAPSCARTWRFFLVCGHRGYDDHKPLAPGHSIVVPEAGNLGRYRLAGGGPARFSVSFRLADGTKHVVEAEFDLRGFDDEQLKRVRPLLTDSSLAGCGFRAPLFACAVKGAPRSFLDFVPQIHDLPIDEAEALTRGLLSSDDEDLLHALTDHAGPTLRIAAYAARFERDAKSDAELVATVAGSAPIGTDVLDAIDPYTSAREDRDTHMKAWLARFETDSDPMVLCWIAYRFGSVGHDLGLSPDERRRIHAAAPRALAQLHHPLARSIFEDAMRKFDHPKHATRDHGEIYEMGATLAAALPRATEPAACAAHEDEARALAACDAPDWIHALHLVQRIRAD